MRVVISRKEVLELSDSEAQDVVDGWFKARVGEHFVRDGQLFRQDDYGHHRGGMVDVRIVRVTTVPQRILGHAEPEEMSWYQYDFIMQCIKFQADFKQYRETKAKDK